MTLSPDSQRSAAPGRSVVAQDVRLTGDLVSGGTVEVLGEVIGTIEARTIVIGAEGMVKGAISGGTVDIRGRMEGKVASGSLTLRGAALVAADCSYATLAIESGATVEGHFRRITG